MDNKTIFVVTLKGEGEIKNHTHQLAEDVKRILALVDDESTVEILTRKAAPSLRAQLGNVLQELESGGFIQNKANARASSMIRMVTPKTSAPTSNPQESEDLDFTSGVSTPTLEARERARTQAEAKAKQEAMAARIKAEQETASIKTQLEAVQAKAEAEAKARAEAEARAQQAAEMAKLKAEQEAARVRTEAEAVRIKAEQEAAKARTELETARQEAERARAELEAARVAAEALARREAEAARRRDEEAAAKARAEAEVARIKAEREAAEAAAKARQEAEAARIKAEADARAKLEAEAARRKAEEEIAKARAEAETARLKAEQEAARAKAELEAAQAKAEAEAQARAEAQTRAEASVRAEAEAKAKQEAEAARLKAAQEADRAKAAAEAARLKAEQEAAQVKTELEAAQARAAAEAKAKQEAEAARLKAEQEAARAHAEADEKARHEAEAARLEAEQEIARIKAEAEEQVRQATQAKVNAESALAAKAKADASAARSMIATVLFFDVVGYTKQSVSKQIELKKQFNKLVSEFIQDIEENQRIILDTGDGAAIGFLQHPEDAIEVALKFRNAVTANKHQNYPELKVRIGIHLGPVNIVKDMNGQSNMVGDGINDAQRIMSFASSDHIYISNSYYDVVSRLSAEYAKLFQYRGVKNDKHGRQHQVYEAIVEEPAGEQPGSIESSGAQQEPSPFSITLEPFVLNGLGQTAPAAPSPTPAPEQAPAKAEQAAVARPQTRTETVTQEKPAQKTPQEIEAEAQASSLQKAQQEAEAARLKAEQKAAQAKAELEARQMADEQARTWAEAEQRARAQAATQARMEQEAAQQPGKAPPHTAHHARRKALPLGKIAAGLFALLLVLIVALPYVWPMQSYVAQLEQKLSAQLQQPVHIAHMKAALLPLPKLELQDVSVGGAQELKAANVVLNFSVAALFSETRPIKTAEVNGLALNAGSFGQALAWLQTAGGLPHYPVSHMVLRQARVDGEGLVLPPMNGDADWDAQGRLGKALLRSEDGKLDVELQAQQQRWQIALHIKESSLPWLPGILFNELNAKGEIGENSADFTEIDGHLYGGKLSGSAQLSWQKGWQMQGRLSARAMELQQALPQTSIEGEMDGDGSFLLSAAALPQLASAPRLDGTFTVKKGVIGKVDMVETAANRKSMAGGRTHFDEMSGSLLLENNSQHLRQIRISGGVMNAAGSVDVSPGGQLSGRLSVDLKMRAGSVPLALSGTLAEPMLRPAN